MGEKYDGPNQTEKSSNFLINVIVIVLILQLLLTGYIARGVKSLTPNANNNSTSLLASPSWECYTTQGDPAPNIDLIDTEDREFSLESFDDGYILFMFSSTICPYCEKMYGDLQTFYENRPNDLEMVMISHSIGEGENRQIRKEQGFDFTVLESTREVSHAYGVIATPTFVLVDPDRKLVGCQSLNTLSEIESFVNDYIIN